MTEGVILIQANGEIAVCDQTARQLCGLGDSDRATKELLERSFVKMGLDKAYEEVLITKKESVETTVTVTEPQSAKIACIVNSLKGPGDAYLGTLIILRNITKEYEVEKAKSEFVATVSHELRTPLTAMAEFISIILDGIPGKLNPKQREYLMVISDNIDRMTRIVARLLDMANIETKKTELKREIVNIGDLINNVITFFKSKAETKNILLKATFSGVMPSLYIDKDTIIQVLVNLIDNAIKFTDFWGKIEVGIVESEEEVKISVADSGMGVSPDHIKIIFDKFRQVDQSYGPGAKGVGLGLAICKDLVEMHKGKMWVESELKKGSTFFFTLPKFSEEMLIKEYLIDAVAFARTEHKPLSFLVLDIENYWDLENSFGQSDAQKILKDAGGALKAALRAHDKVVIYKRRKAVAVLTSADKTAASMIEKRVKESIETCNFDWRAREPRPKMIYKLATYPDDATTAKELLDKTGGE